MKIISEKREVVGTLKTLVGNYSLLDNSHRFLSGLYRFNVVDDENFENWVQFIGDFIIIPAQVPTMQDVKRVVSEEEVAKYPEWVDQLQELD